MNLKTIISMTALAGMTLAGSYAQKKSLKEDQKAIKDMCGCYEVTFKYTETFSPEIDYEKHFDYNAKALEWAEIIEDEKDKISLQHLLIVNDSMIVKHWRQDWLYESTERYNFNKDNQWTYIRVPKKEVKGQWTQNVYQVDDSPRYSGSATWIHADGRNYWENTTDAPLPRREYSKRSDYNVMERGNHVEITDEGWLHEQDNKKIIRKEGEADKLLVQEKGYNIYKKVPDSKCKVAQEWWKTHNEFWAKVRDKWSDVYGKNSDLELKSKVDGKGLYMTLFPMDPNTDKSTIDSIIDTYIVE